MFRVLLHYLIVHWLYDEGGRTLWLHACTYRGPFFHHFIPPRDVICDGSFNIHHHPANMRAPCGYIHYKGRIGESFSLLLIIHKEYAMVREKSTRFSEETEPDCIGKYFILCMKNRMQKNKV